MGAALTGVGIAALVAWAGVLLHPARPWDLRPRDGGTPALPEPEEWPEVCVLVPARDEADLLPRTLPALLAQDYPGGWRVVLVDDRSTDGTGDVARAYRSTRLTVADGRPLPHGWAGKVWALEQALAAAGEATYVLLTDADILHEPSSLRGLVAESEALGLALDSRMARLHVAGATERLLVPPFVFFFALLYPMRWVNERRRRPAAAAGGCVLVRRDALSETGMFAAICDAVIDDIALASAVKRRGLQIRLAASDGSVRSLREYRTLAGFWRTVRRTAFTQLRHSFAVLLVTIVLLALLFVAPPALLVAGLVMVSWPVAMAGGLAWLVAGSTYLTTVRLYGLRPGWALSLPLAGLLYGAMTVDSALRHARGGRGEW
jgi:hopene-associated glycosyltransferase HpnB